MKKRHLIQIHICKEEKHGVEKDSEVMDPQVKVVKDKCDVAYRGGAVIWKLLQRAEGMIVFI